MRRPTLLSSVMLAPVVPMALVAQLPATDLETTPGWVAVFLLGAWVMHQILDRAGKLPWSQSPAVPPLTVIEAEKLREILADPSKVDKIHDIVSREDVEKPGYYMVWSSAAERRRLEKTLESQAKLTHATIATLEAIQRSLAELHRKVDAIEPRRQA